MEPEIKKENRFSIPLAIIVAGAIIAGALLLKGSTPPKSGDGASNNGTQAGEPAPVTDKDITKGNPKAGVSLILYTDFQCPFCGAVSGLMPADAQLIKIMKQRDSNWSPFMPEVMNYIKDGKVLFVYRDYAFLGSESLRSSEAARCAGDQGKFWEYHDYLYSHQNGENEGAFSDANLKTFAKNLGLDANSFDTCLDSNKYAQAITDSKSEGDKAGVTGTPKGFILKDGKVVGTIDGAESAQTVKAKLESALK